MFAILAILLAPAYTLVLVCAWKAPVGFQDEAGFHYGDGPLDAGARATMPQEALALPPH